jgi:prepilin-type N-terminal cleavage/methylation domain-containing protein
MREKRNLNKKTYMEQIMDQLKNRLSSERGFSLIESLLSLSIFLIVVLSSLEFFGFTRDLFLKLKTKQETMEAALAALDKMRFDLLEAGLGLQQPISLGVLDGIAISEDTLIIISKEKSYTLLGDLSAGQTSIPLDTTSELKKGRKVCVCDSNKGEIQSLSSMDKENIFLSSPLNYSFLKDETCVFLLREVSLFLDKNKNTLRRKVNTSPAQPLLEEVGLFDFRHETATNLVKLSLSLTTNKEKVYETSVFPKNIALASSR